MKYLLFWGEILQGAMAQCTTDILHAKGCQFDPCSCWVALPENQSAAQFCLTETPIVRLSNIDVCPWTPKDCLKVLGYKVIHIKYHLSIYLSCVHNNLIEIICKNFVIIWWRHHTLMTKSDIKTMIKFFDFFLLICLTQYFDFWLT